MSGAHDEYWSWQARANLERALAGGTSLFFTGANAIYWQVRPEKDGRGGRTVFSRSTRNGPTIWTRSFSTGTLPTTI